MGDEGGVDVDRAIGAGGDGDATVRGVDRGGKGPGLLD